MESSHTYHHLDYLPNSPRKSEYIEGTTESKTPDNYSPFTSNDWTQYLAGQRISPELTRNHARFETLSSNFEHNLSDVDMNYLDERDIPDTNTSLDPNLRTADHDTHSLPTEQVSEPVGNPDNSERFNIPWARVATFLEKTRATGNHLLRFGTTTYEFTKKTGINVRKVRDLVVSHAPAWVTLHPYSHANDTQMSPPDQYQEQHVGRPYPRDRSELPPVYPVIGYFTMQQIDGSSVARPRSYPIFAQDFYNPQSSLSGQGVHPFYQRLETEMDPSQRVNDTLPPNTQTASETLDAGTARSQIHMHRSGHVVNPESYEPRYSENTPTQEDHVRFLDHQFRSVSPDYRCQEERHTEDTCLICAAFKETSYNMSSTQHDTMHRIEVGTRYSASQNAQRNENMNSPHPDQKYAMEESSSRFFTDGEIVRNSSPHPNCHNVGFPEDNLLHMSYPIVKDEDSQVDRLDNTAHIKCDRSSSNGLNVRANKAPTSPETDEDCSEDVGLNILKIRREVSAPESTKSNEENIVQGDIIESPGTPHNVTQRDYTLQNITPNDEETHTGVPCPCGHDSLSIGVEYYSKAKDKVSSKMTALFGFVQSCRQRLRTRNRHNYNSCSNDTHLDYSVMYKPKLSVDTCRETLQDSSVDEASADIHDCRPGFSTKQTENIFGEENSWMSLNLRDKQNVEIVVDLANEQAKCSKGSCYVSPSEYENWYANDVQQEVINSSPRVSFDLEHENRDFRSLSLCNQIDIYNHYTICEARRTNSAPDISELFVYEYEGSDIAVELERNVPIATWDESVATPSLNSSIFPEAQAIETLPCTIPNHIKDSNKKDDSPNPIELLEQTTTSEHTEMVFCSGSQSNTTPHFCDEKNTSVDPCYDYIEKTDIGESSPVENNIKDITKDSEKSIEKSNYIFSSCKNCSHDKSMKGYHCGKKMCLLPKEKIPNCDNLFSDSYTSASTSCNHVNVMKNVYSGLHSTKTTSQYDTVTNETVHSEKMLIEHSHDARHATARRREHSSNTESGYTYHCIKTERISPIGESHKGLVTEYRMCSKGESDIDYPCGSVEWKNKLQSLATCIGSFSSESIASVKSGYELHSDCETPGVSMSPRNTSSACLYCNGRCLRRNEKMSNSCAKTVLCQEEIKPKCNLKGTTPTDETMMVKRSCEEVKLKKCISKSSSSRINSKKKDTCANFPNNECTDSSLDVRQKNVNKNVVKCKITRNSNNNQDDLLRLYNTLMTSPSSATRPGFRHVFESGQGRSYDNPSSSQACTRSPIGKEVDKLTCGEYGSLCNHSSSEISQVAYTGHILPDVTSPSVHSKDKECYMIPADFAKVSGERNDNNWNFVRGEKDKWSVDFILSPIVSAKEVIRLSAGDTCEERKLKMREPHPVQRLIPPNNSIRNVPVAADGVVEDHPGMDGPHDRDVVDTEEKSRRLSKVLGEVSKFVTKRPIYRKLKKFCKKHKDKSKRSIKNLIKSIDDIRSPRNGDFLESHVKDKSLNKAPEITQSTNSVTLSVTVSDKESSSYLVERVNNPNDSVPNDPRVPCKAFSYTVTKKSYVEEKCHIRTSDKSVCKKTTTQDGNVQSNTCKSSGKTNRPCDDKPCIKQPSICRPCVPSRKNSPPPKSCIEGQKKALSASSSSTSTEDAHWRTFGVPPQASENSSNRKNNESVSYPINNPSSNLKDNLSSIGARGARNAGGICTKIMEAGAMLGSTALYYTQSAGANVRALQECVIQEFMNCTVPQSAACKTKVTWYESSRSSSELTGTTYCDQTSNSSSKKSNKSSSNWSDDIQSPFAPSFGKLQLQKPSDDARRKSSETPEKVPSSTGSPSQENRNSPAAESSHDTFSVTPVESPAREEDRTTASSRVTPRSSPTKSSPASVASPIKSSRTSVASPIKSSRASVASPIKSSRASVADSYVEKTTKSPASSIFTPRSSPVKSSRLSVVDSDPEEMVQSPDSLASAEEAIRTEKRNSPKSKTEDQPRKSSFGISCCKEHLENPFRKLHKRERQPCNECFRSLTGCGREACMKSAVSYLIGNYHSDEEDVIRERERLDHTTKAEQPRTRTKCFCSTKCYCSSKSYCKNRGPKNRKTKRVEQYPERTYQQRDCTSQTKKFVENRTGDVDRKADYRREMWYKKKSRRKSTELTPVSFPLNKCCGVQPSDFENWNQCVDTHKCPENDGNYKAVKNIFVQVTEAPKREGAKPKQIGVSLNFNKDHPCPQNNGGCPPGLDNDEVNDCRKLRYECMSTKENNTGGECVDRLGNLCTETKQEQCCRVLNIHTQKTFKSEGTFCRPENCVHLEAKATLCPSNVIVCEKCVGVEPADMLPRVPVKPPPKLYLCTEMADKSVAPSTSNADQYCPTLCSDQYRAQHPQNTFQNCNRAVDTRPLANDSPHELPTWQTRKPIRQKEKCFHPCMVSCGSQTARCAGAPENVKNVHRQVTLMEDSYTSEEGTQSQYGHASASNGLDFRRCLASESSTEKTCSSISETISKYPRYFYGERKVKSTQCCFNNAEMVAPHGHQANGCTGRDTQNNMGFFNKRKKNKMMCQIPRDFYLPNSCGPRDTVVQPDSATADCKGCHQNTPSKRQIPNRARVSNDLDRKDVHIVISPERITSTRCRGLSKEKNPPATANTIHCRHCAIHVPKSFQSSHEFESVGLKSEDKRVGSTHDTRCGSTRAPSGTVSSSEDALGDSSCTDIDEKELKHLKKHLIYSILEYSGKNCVNR